MCVDTINGTKDNLKHTWNYSQTYGDYDLNNYVNSGPRNTTEKVKTFSQRNDFSFWMMGS